MPLVIEKLRQSNFKNVLCHIFVQHTSASLTITDSEVRRGIENFMSKLVLDGNPAYLHDQERPDNIATQIRKVLTQTDITIPITAGKPFLGTCQGLYVWEHRAHPHHRRLIITING